MSTREKQGLGVIFVLFFIFATSLFFSLRAHAAPSNLRLIETGPNQRQWMTESQVGELARQQHEQGHCGGFMDVTEHPQSNGMVVFSPTIPNRPLPTHGDQVQRILPELSAANLIENVTRLSDFRNRFYKSELGAKAANWIKDQFIELAKGRTDVKVELFKHSFLQPSVIATIQGTGPHAKEHVILGAHEDSVNWKGSWIAPDANARAPGADDDASGVATLLETYRVLMDSGFRPDRTLVFMTYAGEELGLLGSQDIAQKFRADNKIVAGVLQLDMTLFPGQNRTITFINDHVDQGLTKFTEMLVDAYVKAPWREAPCNYACSDHASWSKAGYPSAFPFEAPMGEDNPKIHTEDDTLQNNLDAAFGLHFAKLATAFAIELASE